MGPAFRLLPLLFLTLAGCVDTSLDADQARLCRLALPALHPEGAAVTVINEVPGTAPGSVRIDYRVVEPGRPARVARTSCVFGASGVQPGRLNIVSIAIDGIALSDAKLYILKRWWLGELGVADDNTPAQARTSTPQMTLKPGLAYFLQQVVNAIPVGAVYALLAVAYSLVYGLVGRIVLAFGDIAIFGAYGVALGIGLAVALGLASTPVTLLIGLAAGLALSTGLATLIGRHVVGPLAGRPGQATIVASLGLSIAIQEFLRLTQGADDKWLTPLSGEPLILALSPSGFAATVTPMQIFIAGIALAAASGTLLFMQSSSFGRNWKAVADDPLAASLFGVDARRTMVGTMALGGALGGLAGWILLVQYGGIGFSNGLAIGLKALAAAVLGGIGSPGGALLGGIVVGFAETFWSGYFDLAWRDVVVFGALILTLAFRPGGFFGFAELGPRRV
jgi:branched-chain amino acid transport system permease protein